MKKPTNLSKIVLATSNLGKVREFQQILQLPEGMIIPQNNLAVPEVAETGLTFIENAIIKARNAAKVTGLPAIADDSGLVVDALNGAPGIYSARYAGEQATADMHIQKLLQVLIEVPEGKRSARFYCCLVYLSHAEDAMPIIAEGIWEGQILFEPVGKQGFGYDPVFYVPTHDCSAAELPSAEKNRISHRGQALQKLMKIMMEE